MARVLFWAVLAAFAVDALFLASIFWALSVSYNTNMPIGILLLVMWVAWLALLVTALLAAGRRQAGKWRLTFGLLGILGSASTVLVLFKATTAPVFLLYFNLLQPFFQDTVQRTIVGGLLLLLTGLLPLPLAALWYGGIPALDDSHR